MPALLAAVPPDVRNAFESTLSRAVDAGGIDAPTTADLGDLPSAVETFRVVQAFEAWQAHGAWLAAHPGAVSGTVADRFAAAAAVTEEQAAAARVELAIRRRALDRRAGPRWQSARLGRGADGARVRRP